MKKRKIIFAYRGSQKNMGGKLMRVDQLSEIARKYFPENYEIETQFVPKDRYINKTKQFITACKDAVIIFHKSAASNLSQETRKTLRQIAAGICVDHLDINVDWLEKGFFDIHIAASRTGEKILTGNLSLLDAASGTQVRHLRHHADPRLYNAKTAEHLKSIKPGYFGLLYNVDDLNALPPNTYIPKFEINNIESFLAAYSNSNLHFCVRTPFSKNNVLSTKPFTKGFNAAIVKANVLVNRQVHDAVYYLGDDYPFMINENSKDAIIEGFAKAQDAFGTIKWKQALKRMEDMAARISPNEVARELKQIIDLF